MKRTYGRFYGVLGMVMGVGVMSGCSVRSYAGPAVAALKGAVESHRTVKPFLPEGLVLVESLSAESPPDTLEPPLKEVLLSLEAVRTAVLMHNLKLKVAVLERDIAVAQVGGAKAAFDWLLVGSATRTGGAALGGEMDLGSLGLTVPLPGGGSVSVTPGVEGATEDEEITAALGFSVSQPLLRGAGVGSSTASIAVARISGAVGNARAKLGAIELLGEAEKVYWDLYGAVKAHEVQVAQYALAEEQVLHAQRYVESGFASEVEVLRAQAGLTARMEAVIVAGTTLRRRERALKRLLNRPDLPVGSGTRLLAETAPTPEGVILDRGKLVELARKERMDLFEAELILVMRDVERAKAVNDLLPEVGFLGSVSYFGTEAASLKGAFERIGVKGEFPGQWSVGVMASFPLQNRGARAAAAAARMRELQSRWARDELFKEVEREVHDAADIFEGSWERILATRKATAAAGLTYEAEKRQFQLGVVTSTEVLEAAGALSLVQLREIEALVDYQKARVEVALATGTMLGMGAVEWGQALGEWP